MSLKATAVTSKTRKHGKLLFLLRILQLLACITMLILFSIRLARIKRLTAHTPSSVGAVEGILAAATLYTLLALPLASSHNKLISLGFLALDIAFIAGFIVVSVLTSPKHYTAAWACLGGGLTVNYHMEAFAYCSLPWGPFILGILSTLSFSATAALQAMGGGRNSGVSGEKGGLEGGPVTGDGGVA